jgi:hypothetical protein
MVCTSCSFLHVWAKAYVPQIGSTVEIRQYCLVTDCFVYLFVGRVEVPVDSRHRTLSHSYLITRKQHFAIVACASSYNHLGYGFVRRGRNIELEAQGSSPELISQEMNSGSQAIGPRQSDVDILCRSEAQVNRFWKEIKLSERMTLIELQ